MLEHCCGDLIHSATRALLRSGNDVGRLDLARSRRSNSSQRCSIRLWSGHCAGQSTSSTPISTNHFSMDLALCAGHCHDETGKILPQTVATKFKSTELSIMSLYAVVSRLPFTGNKGPSPNHEKQPQPIIPPHQTLQLALCIRAGNILFASAKPRFVRWTARW